MMVQTIVIDLDTGSDEERNAELIRNFEEALDEVSKISLLRDPDQDDDPGHGTVYVRSYSMSDVIS